MAAAMPTYHNAGGGYPNVSAPARQAKLDGNQNHHTIPSNVTSHPLIQNSTQQHSVPSNLTAGNIPSHPVSPTMTTHSSVTAPNITTHMNTASTPVILTSNAINPGNTTALPVNPRHEVKLNAMPYVSIAGLTRHSKQARQSKERLVVSDFRCECNTQLQFSRT